MRPQTILGTAELLDRAEQQGRTVAVLQPSYLPWLGYFAQLHRCDHFVLLDDVQYDKHGWRNRNRIKTQTGPCWLTVPVRTHGLNRPRLGDVFIDNTRCWRKKHFETLRQSYRSAPYYHNLIDLYAALYAREYETLLEVNLAFFTAINQWLGLQRPIQRASDWNITGSAVERLIAICQRLEATHFYEGAAGRNYLDAQPFDRAGIELVYQDYKHPVYPQLHGDFVPYLSVVDLLFNCGRQSLELLIS